VKYKTNPYMNSVILKTKMLDESQYMLWDREVFNFPTCFNWKERCLAPFVMLF